MIGIGEGLLTATVLLYIHKERPEMLTGIVITQETTRYRYRKIYIVLLTVTLILAGILSLLASSNPDGLEWSIEKVSETGLETTDSVIHQKSESIQEDLSLLPDYNYKDQERSSWSGTSFAGFIGSGMTFAVVVLIALLAKLSKKRRRKKKVE
jgi:cobalt/nickel transport system permease protein